MQEDTVIEQKLSKDGSIHVTDEKFNTISHMLGAIFALFGTVVLIVFSAVAKRPWSIVSFSIYGVTLILVFLASSMHHGINSSPKIESFLRLMDYLVIFPLIAGTYTPLCLIMCRDKWGWSVAGVLWGLTLLGIILKSVFPSIPKWVTNTLYVGIGWVGVALVFKIFKELGWIGLILIALGGIFYTVGSLIFYLEKPNPVKGKFGFHEIWHIFVILGAACHYFAMYFVVLPYGISN